MAFVAQAALTRVGGDGGVVVRMEKWGVLVVRTLLTRRDDDNKNIAAARTPTHLIHTPKKPNKETLTIDRSIMSASASSHHMCGHKYPIGASE
jgi:hypothetical protein